MKLDALDHPKTLDFAARLDVTRPTAIGHLELLWGFTAKQSSQGNIGKWHDGAIARACDWMGAPDVFIAALIDSGFVDRDPSYRLTVHDWSDHAPGWVRAKLKKVGLDFISSERSSKPSSERSSDCSGDDSDETSERSSEASKLTSEASSRAPVSKGRVGKGREDKPREGKAPAARLIGATRKQTETSEPFDPATVPGLDAESWKRWVDYRAERKPAIKRASMQAAAEELAKFGELQSDVVKHSIANGYQGLFAPKVNGNGAHASPSVRYRSAEEVEDEYIARYIVQGLTDAQIAALEDLACAPNLPARISAKREELRHA